MSENGLAKDRLERMSGILSGYVERKELPGMVALVSRGNDLYAQSFGTLSFTNPAPMNRDTIFRIASITKPVVAVAAMILLEECRFRLDDPIDKWLPELANRRVLRSLEGNIDATVPAERAITVRDVLTYRMGFGSIMAMPDTYPIQRHIRELGIGGDGPQMPSVSMDEWLRRLGSLPLIAQPGEKWMYHVSGDLLGPLIARVTGQSLGAFLRERIFDPLGMKDAGFQVPAEKSNRLSDAYAGNPQTGALEVWDSAEGSKYLKEPAFESGGGGLLCSIDDYYAFSRMLLGKGHFEGVQVLSPASVELMTSGHLTPEQRSQNEIFFGDFSTWGFGMAVDIARREIYHSPGRFGWTGGYGTTAYIDPANDLIGILFTQRMMDSPEPPGFFSDFWTLAYAAME